MTSQESEHFYIISLEVSALEFGKRRDERAGCLLGSFGNQLNGSNH